MQLITPRLILREFRDSDFEALREIETIPDTHYYEKGTPGEAVTREFLSAAQTSTHQEPRSLYRLAITLPPSDQVRGRIKLIVQTAETREWEIGWAVHKQEWGKGYATEAAREVMRFAFEELNAHRLIAFCNTGNLASARVMEKLGMRQDGRLRQALWWQGRWVDELVYAILDSEWNHLRVSTSKEK
jgi:[ribosomal protein S5]-alanine N-acetyltransferase